MSGRVARTLLPSFNLDQLKSSSSSSSSSHAPTHPPTPGQRIFFDHPVFHPSVDPSSGELDLRGGFHDNRWKRNVNHIWQVLLYARRAFYRIDTGRPANQEAARM